MTDIEIAQSCEMKPIREIAASLGISEDDLEYYGKFKAKLPLTFAKKKREDNKLILVTAITPTPAGEGKTTTTIGLSDALHLMGKDVSVALREPS